jgi:hypothetical protein
MAARCIRRSVKCAMLQLHKSCNSNWDLPQSLHAIGREYSTMKKTLIGRSWFNCSCFFVLRNIDFWWRGVFRKFLLPSGWQSRYPGSK